MNNMNEEQFFVQFVPSKNCFLQFSNKWLQKLNNYKCSCLRLTYRETNNELRFTWSPQPGYGLNNCTIGINATFANSLNLHENQLVTVSSEEKITQLTRVFLTPSSSDDYEILEMSQDNVEESLLNQVRVVNVKQIVTVWVSKTVHLKLAVDRIEPEASCGRLEQLTELVIENIKQTGPVTYPQTTHDHESPSMSDLIPSVDHSTWLLSRVHPFPNCSQPVSCCHRSHDESFHPFNVFVNKQTLQKEFVHQRHTFLKDLLKGDHAAVLCRIESIPLQRQKHLNSKTSDGEKVEKDNVTVGREDVSVCVRLYMIEDSCEVFRLTQTNVHCVYVSLLLRTILNSRVGSRVRLKAFKPPLNKMLSSITLVPSTELDNSKAELLVQQFSERLIGREGVLVNNLCPLSLDLLTLVYMFPPELPCWPLTRPQLEVCPVTVATVPDTDLTRLTKQLDNESPVPLVTSVFEELVKEGMTALDFTLRLSKDQYQDRMLDNILITGKRGSGKSRLTEAFCSRMSGPPHYVHVSTINCKSLKGKKPETIGKIVSDLLAECIYYGPAVLVLEDLPSIAGMVSGDLEPSMEAGYFLRVATMLRELMWNQTSVSMLATAQSRQSVHPQLLSARGRHTFTTFLHIPPLHKSERVKLLSELVGARTKTTQPFALLEEIGAKTEGCVARDLCRFVNRAVFSTCKRGAQEVSLCTADVDTALQGFVPEGFSNTSLTHHSPNSFSKVGGLVHAKQLLTQVLIWPTKYQEMFSQCPLRLERGVLLYGAPGTGKTLLASAVAGECGLNFIIVKGPELLSKYIGASEEAVRNIFQKAQSAQPCILFFDEFDSLAPRRGHDSTGVTDRVVNQLLTQMDGVEALEGVWIVAAASRPDLLDPALLRPGRIGSLVHCPLPTEEERLAILQTLSLKLQLSEDSDLAAIATQTENFTGADCKALLFTAQMAAYDSAHPDSDDDDLQVTATPMETVVISQRHLLAALKETTPSLKPHDRQRFQIIYEKFQKSREGNGDPREQTQRVTLA